MADILKTLLSLQPKLIDPAKCTTDQSLNMQISNIENRERISERQARQFNLGNSQRTANPINAAGHILKREYRESSLFARDEHTSVFIPPIFVSNQYKESCVAVLEYDVKKHFDELLGSLKNSTDWFTKEFKAFMQSQNSADCIDKPLFDQWCLNLQIMYLVIKELKNEEVSLRSTTLDNFFVQACIQNLPAQSAFKTSLQESLSNTKNLRKLVKSKIKDIEIEDPNLQWLFGLELGDLGERVEHWFYDQLLPLKDDILQDTVVLSSTNFLTNVRKKMYEEKETDFLIISWERKLIISIEMKRTLVDKVFKQLESNYRVFQEKLGDQLKPGWMYFPVIAVEKDSLMSAVKSPHYITMKTEIKPWLSSIFNKFTVVKTTSGPGPLDEVKSLLKILIFAIHVSKKDQTAPITTSTWVEYTSNAIKNVSTSDNILFYSNKQMAVMNNDDPRYRKLIIRGPFGSGKSFLLQQKAIQLSQKQELKGPVLYAVQYEIASSPSMFYYRLKIDLEENHGVIVERVIKDDYDGLMNKIKNRGVKAVFIDESHLLRQQESWIEEVMKIVDFLWIVPSTMILSGNTQNHDVQNHLYPKDFRKLDLSLNFRNSQKIVQEAKSEADKKNYKYKEGIAMSSLANFPSGLPPIRVKSFEEAVNEARSRTTTGGIVVMIDETVKEDCIKVLKSLNQPYKDAFGTGIREEEENPYKFLQEENAVLIINVTASLGFEWSTVIVAEYASFSSPTINICNFMLRCTTNLIILEGHNLFPRKFLLSK